MKMLNDKKICFIICTNKEYQLRECLWYLNLLEVPEGYETEILTIENAKSMTSGYNEGMNASDAKYKIYLHQDTFIREPFFIEKILKIFKRDKKIGMIGMIGTESLSKDGVIWNNDRCGSFYQLEESISNGVDNIELIKRGIREVEAIDGLLMATQYDIPWREDILKGWDFYDISQCMEFRRKGYKIVVPGQKSSWVIHHCGIPALWNYEKTRKIIMKEYPEIVQSKKGKLRILYMKTNMIDLEGLPYCFKALGHQVTIWETKVTLVGLEQRDVDLVEHILQNGLYDMVFTYDFARGVAEACNNMKVKYYAWVYDDPLWDLYSEQAKYEYSYISVFDKKQYQELQGKGLKHLFYLPLSPEVDFFGAIKIKERDIKKYSCDVSFLGRLYNKKGYEKCFDPKDTEMREMADEIAGSCHCIWDGENNLFGKAPDELIDYLSSMQPKDVWETWTVDKRYYCEAGILCKKCNEVERIELLNRLAQKREVILYSVDTPEGVLHDNVKIRPWVDYLTEMPKVFYLSKININITSRSIESGIPQRIWDVMSVGGFCLTNYQPELEDFFVIGRDLEVYHNLDELEEKIDYYLTHEEERLRIAINGYQLVREKHNSKERLKVAINYIFGDLGGDA